MLQGGLWAAISLVGAVSVGRKISKRKTPAYAVLTTFLNLYEKWVPSIVALGFSSPARAG